MNLSRLCKGVKPYCKKIKSQTAFVKELFKAAGNGYISDSYAKQLYSGGKPFTNELKAGFGSTDRTQKLIAFFEGNITDAAGALVDFGIPEKTDCDKKALCVALTRQMQKLINGTDDVDDILAMTYEAEKANTSEEITGVLPQPLYNGDSVNAFYNRTHVIQSYDKVLHQWEIMNTGRLIWAGRKLVYMRGEKDRPEANPSVIELPDVRPNQSIKITTTIDGRGFDGITYCKWEMQDADGQNCFPKRDTIFSVTIDAKYKRD